ncbi:uncharacterized protein MELLADRAFT_111026 [Melampsora larici-populina 98AG31]|uniref:Secreted protein n=1 Tax=Melampsora larici-populina (strain 98AG31 / pathotype 3-4-7) TaxID=747676 RepID=F4S1T1_MELLP|nr:uncharacterized protein MELLADRAFT_111026 [Melampsora larici-populina 98AG31]EGG01429.1 hypothetical protein MELLADRAFT_111026 [Melampsora larici-populina 98AG31]
MRSTFVSHIVTCLLLTSAVSQGGVLRRQLGFSSDCQTNGMNQACTSKNITSNSASSSASAYSSGPSPVSSESSTENESGAGLPALPSMNETAMGSGAMPMMNATVMGNEQGAQSAPADGSVTSSGVLLMDITRLKFNRYGALALLHRTSTLSVAVMMSYVL